MFKNVWQALSAKLCPNPLTVRAALGRCRQRIPRVGTLLDIGASNGSWSLLARDCFPEMTCFMVEAQEEHAATLAKLKASHAGFDYCIAAAGNEDGTVNFQGGDLFGGVATHQHSGDGYRQVPMVAVDSLVRERGLVPPFLLKLDTHGFEVPILEGARDTLTQTALVVVEVYNFQLSSDSLRFHEMCACLESRGFRCVDMCDPIFRKDGVLWQMDLFFVPANAAEFASNSYA